MRRFLVVALLALCTSAPRGDVRTHSFEDPIDALSVGLADALLPGGGEGAPVDLAVSALQSDGTWTPWQSLEVETEFDPLLRESNLVMFPEPVTEIRVRGSIKEYTLHPIRISRDPARVEVASRTPLKKPKILSRFQWGADESFLVVGEETARSDTPAADRSNENNGNGHATGDVPQRVRDCEDAMRNYPEQFKTARRIEEDSQGRSYRWPLEYSPEVRLLVVHHTALRVSGDARPPLERMRALYAYHANNRGWGDIGYHYVIDEEGQIYEGKAGGDSVVGGHAYCANVGTVGVALMGNFEVERPSQAQMQSLQRLLDLLAEKYGIDLRKNAVFHGKNLPPIVGHRDLVSTSCPGYYVRETLGQVRDHVASGDIGGAIVFPKPLKEGYRDRTGERKAERSGSRPLLPEEPRLAPVGATSLTGRPGQELSFVLRLQAGTLPLSRRSRVAEVSRSDPRIGLWQRMEGAEQRVRYELILPETLRPGETTLLQLRMQFPQHEGAYQLQIGEIEFTLRVEGMRIRSPRGKARYQSYEPAKIEQARRTYAGKRRPDDLTPLSATAAASGGGPLIRIRLTKEEKGMESCAGAPLAALRKRFRGTVECAVIAGKTTLINELPLEDYIAGLAEEPDSEPYEKQRAFAIAARSYAAHYLDPENRKFPGMPYDGDDSAERFQSYGGIAFEERNPAWARAVRSTAGLVLMKDGTIVKAAYFSSDDGRTRSPEENGWKNFPFAEIFASKPDPWCAGMPMAGHGVGMSGCGAEGQALEGKRAEEILAYYYPGALLEPLGKP